jgi:hypothetical protein
MALGFNKKEETEKPVGKKNNLLSGIFDGNAINTFLKNQVGLIILILAFMFFYISNRYECQQKLMDIVKLEKQLTDVKYEALTRSAELMGGSKQSQVKELIVEKGIALEESQTPPFSIAKPIEEEKK